MTRPASATAWAFTGAGTGRGGTLCDEHSTLVSVGGSENHPPLCFYAIDLAHGSTSL